MPTFRRTILALSLACALPAAHASTAQRWANLSTALALGLPAIAAAQTWSQGDVTPGGEQLVVTLGGTFLATEALKHTIHERRPDNSGTDSFPSGHTAIAFAAASYLDKRYDGQHRWLLYSMAGLTAVARVQADKHYWKDVIAGGLLGYTVGQLSTSTRQVTVAPLPGGLAVYWRQIW